jgi:hypothetical protein
MSMELWVNDTGRYSKNTRKNTRLSSNFYTTNLTPTGPEANQGLRCERKTNHAPEQIEARSVPKFIPYFTQNTALSITKTVLLILLGRCRCSLWESCEKRKYTVLAKCTVFITETECVYCGVRTGCLYIIQVMCFVWISEQRIFPYRTLTNWFL